MRTSDRLSEPKKHHDMYKTLLLPHALKKIGWGLLVPALLLGALIALNQFDGLPGIPASASWAATLNNCAIIGILVGALLVTCSRERIEDEMIARIRLNALLVALYANTAVSVVAALAAYGFSFLNFMIYNLFTLPLLFLVLFYGQLWRLRKEAGDEK